MGTPLAELAREARAGLGKVIVGHDEPLELLLLTLVCGGHALLEGVPGLGKTLAVRTLARILGLRFRRVQCTPDLMPADITGSSVLNMATSEFRFHAGRSSPTCCSSTKSTACRRARRRRCSKRWKSGRSRSTARRSRSRRSFTVFATQNPVEFEGTYPLPEAELDRFLVKIRLGIPAARREEEAILARHQAWLRRAGWSTVDVARSSRTTSPPRATKRRAIRVDRRCSPTSPRSRGARANGRRSRSAPARARRST